MLAKDVRALLEAYGSIYSNTEPQQELIDEEVNNILEEVIEELIEECVELGYSLDEAAEVVEEATIEYLTELNPYAPAGSKESRAYNKATTATKRGEARKAAVKAAVGKVRQKAAGAAVSAYAAGREAKERIGSAASAARTGAKKAAGAVSTAASSAKKSIKSGIKKALGGGLRAVANRAGKAASRLGEESVLEARAVGKARSTDQNPNGAGARVSSGRGMTMTKAGGLGKGKTFKNNPDGDDMVKSQYDAQAKADRRAAAKERAADGGDRVSNLIRSVQKSHYEPDDIYDLVLEYLVHNGHAETIDEAHYIMLEMDEEFIKTIVEGSGIVTGTAKAINTVLKPTNQTPAQGKAAVGNITRGLDVVAKPIKSILSPANNSPKAQQQRIDKYRP